MTTFTIYGHPNSTFTRTALMAAQEKGIAYDFVETPPHSETMLALHPFGKIPAARHGDLVLWESGPICRYIDESFDGPALIPHDKAARFRMESWVSAINDSIVSTILFKIIAQYVFPQGPNGEVDRKTIDAALPKAAQQLALIDATLAEHDFLAGPEISLADLYLAPIMTYLARMPEGPDLLKEHANIHRAGAAMTARPSYQNTMPPMAKDAAE